MYIYEEIVLEFIVNYFFFSVFSSLYSSTRLVNVIIPELLVYIINYIYSGRKDILNFIVNYSFCHSLRVQVTVLNKKKGSVV